MSTNTKKVPASIGIFGGSGHIGGPMARWLRYNAPHVKVRLITSNAQKVDQLRANFPGCEVAIGDYFDLPSLTDAVAGMEGLYAVTTTFTPEDIAMTNLISAIRRSNTLIHLIRVIGVFPGANPRRVPEVLVKFGKGLEIQHQIARRLLDESDLPVTYFNIGASFMDNLLMSHIYSRAPRKISWPERRVPYIDPREIGEAAARILLSDNHRHLYQFHTLNNGSDSLYMNDIVNLMSDVVQCKIAYDSSKEGFLSVMEPIAKLGYIPATLAEYLWNFTRYEDQSDVAWSLNDCLERILGRKPNTMRAWLQEHRETLCKNLGTAS
ncbi:MAG: hypothetical protein EPO08_11295 [Rhodospirillaceae bacterium]|nr:MAG: hypothetical protein EPO08_11295 [Rhodospirillaceae bacterium]